MIFILFFFISFAVWVAQMLYLTLCLPNKSKSINFNIAAYCFGYIIPALIDVVLILIIGFFEKDVAIKDGILLAVMISIYLLIVLVLEKVVISKKRRNYFSKEAFEKTLVEQRYDYFMSYRFSLIPWILNLMFKVICWGSLINLIL